ncbi:MAG: hypothetical protein KDD70_09935, partial [Bdellovibrionales bacterium]|nr:hypothetical protein [Bdellovibrionales bacterium]
MDSNFLQYNRRVNIPTELLPRRSVDELDTAFSSLSGKERQELTSKQIRDRTRVLAPLRQEVQKEWDVVQKPVREVLSKLSSAISHTIPVLEAFKELDSAVEHIREGSTSELPAPAARAIEKLQMTVGREGGHLLPVYYEKLADTLSTHKEERLAQFHSQNSQNKKLALEFLQHACELNARFPEVISAEQVNRVEGAVTAFTLPLPEGSTPQPQDAINTQQELLAAMAEVEETIGRHSPKISLTDPRLRDIARERVERLQGGTIKPPPQEQTKKAVELSLTLGLVKFDAERTVLDANRLAESIVTELLENFQAREIKSAANRLFDRLERERSKNPTSFTRNGQLELDDIISGKQPETMHLSKLPAPYCSVSQDSVLQFRLVLEPLIDEFTAKRTVLAETFGYSPREATAGARARSLEDINRSKQLCETAAIEPQLATALYKANPSLFHKTEDEVRATFDAVERFCHEHQEYLSIAIYNPKKNPAAFGSVDAVNAQIAAIRTALSTSEGSASLRSELSNSRFQSAVKELALGKPLQLVATLLRYGFASADGTATSGTEPLNAKTIRQKVKEALPEFEANVKAVRDCLLVLSEAKLVTR